MKDYSSSLSGGYSESWTDDIYGRIPREGSKFTAVSAVQQNVLSGVGSAVGNFKDPNNQSYNHLWRSGQTINYSEYRKASNGKVYSYSKVGTNSSSIGFQAHTDPGAYNNALSKLGDAIRGSLDVSIDAFQGKQTVALVKNLTSVRKAFTFLCEQSFTDTSVKQRRNSHSTRRRTYAFKRSRKDAFAAKRSQFFDQPMKDVGSLWLQFQYGLRPTLQTLFDLVNGTAVRAGNTMAIRNSKGFLGVTGQAQVEKKYVVKDTWYSETTVYRTTFRYKFGGTYLPSNSHVETLSRLSSLNPVNILWELLPFSFVVDWIVDIGGYLRSAETAMISNLGTFRGYQTFTKREMASVEQLFFGTHLSIEKRGSIIESAYRTSKTRSKLTSVPYPRRPRFNVDLGSERLLNAAALLSQVLTSSNKR